MSKSWYSISSKGDSVVNISIHDEIGYWGISAKDFIEELAQYPDAKVINLSVHSPGGEMLDGFAIFNALKANSATVHGHVEGIAASMASVILMACDVVSMPENAFIMIHNPSGGAWGESDDLRHMADLMDKLKQSAMNIYQAKTGLSDDVLSEMLDAETWFTADEALEHGFIDTITDKVQIAAKINGFDKHFKSMPIKSELSIDNINTQREFESFLRESGGVSRRVATALSSRAKTIFQSESEPSNSATMNELSNALSRFKVPDSL